MSARESRTSPARPGPWGCVLVLGYNAMAVDCYVLARDPGALAHAVRRSCQIKAAVVGQDLRDLLELELLPVAQLKRQLLRERQLAQRRGDAVTPVKVHAERRPNEGHRHAGAIELLAAGPLAVDELEQLEVRHAPQVAPRVVDLLAPQLAQEFGEGLLCEVVAIGVRDLAAKESQQSRVQLGRQLAGPGGVILGSVGRHLRVLGVDVPGAGHRGSRSVKSHGDGSLWAPSVALPPSAAPKAGSQPVRAQIGHPGRSTG